MIIQKINYSLNFSAKTEYVNQHQIRKDEPKLSTKIKEILAGEPDLEEDQVYRITRSGYFQLEDGYDENSLDELNLAIHDKNGKPLSDPVTLYRKRVALNPEHNENHYGQIGDILELDSNIKRIAKQLRENLVAKAKAAFEALKKHANSLGYDLVKRATRTI